MRFHRLTVIGVVIIMILSVFVGLLASNTDAWSSDFSTSDGWTIIGTGHTISAGKLNIDITRDNDDLCKHEFNETDVLNITFEINFSTIYTGGDGAVYRFEVTENNLTQSTTGPDNYTGFIFGHAGNSYIQHVVKEDGGSETSVGAYNSLATSTTYHCNLNRSQNPGNSTWRVDGKVWTSAGSFTSPNILDTTYWYPGTPANVTHSIFRNYNSGSSSFNMVGTVDNYKEDFDGYQEEDPPSDPMQIYVYGDGVFLIGGTGGSRSSEIELIPDPDNPVFPSGVCGTSVIVDGDQLDVWAASGTTWGASGYDCLWYTNTTFPDLSAYATPQKVLTGIRFPTVCEYGGVYYLFSLTAVGSDVYLWSSTDKTTWTPMNGGDPVLTRSTDVNSQWWYFWNPGVVVDGDGIFHMWVECANEAGQPDQTGVRLGYTKSTLAAMDWDGNRTEDNIIDKGGKPQATYVSDRGGILLMYGQLINGYWQIRASTVSLSSDLSSASSYTEGYDFGLGTPTQHCANPALAYVGPTAEYDIVIQWFHNQPTDSDIYQHYIDGMTLGQLYDAWGEGFSGLGEISTAPLIAAINGTAYYYDADCTGTTGWNLSTNCSGLSIDSNGNVSGTPSVAGIYWVNITADNGTATTWQNYTLRVYSHLDFYRSANDSPSTVYYWEAGIRYGYDFYVPLLRDGSAQGDLMVAKYDGANGSWSYSGVLAANPTDDDHAGTVLIKTMDDYFHMFYGCHETAIQHLVSDAPFDYLNWTVASSPGSSATYPQPWVNPDNGTVYLFYRKTVSSGSDYDHVMKISTDNCTTWGSEIQIHTYDSGYATYLWYSEPVQVNGHWHIPATWSIHNYTSGERENCHYAYLNISDNHLYNVTGYDLGTTINTAENDDHCMIVDAGTDAVFDTRCRIDVDTGKIYYFMNAQDGGTAYYNTFMHYDGSEWSSWQVMTESTIGPSWANMFLYNDTVHLYLPCDTNTRVEHWTYNTTTDTWGDKYTIIDLQLMSPGTVIGITGVIWNTTTRSILIAECGSGSGDPVYVYVYGEYGYLINGTPLYLYEPPEAPEEHAPTISDPNPSHYIQDVSVDLATWTCTISDVDGDLLNWTIEISTGDNSSGDSESNGTKGCSLTGLEYHTIYYIWVNATDGTDWTNESFRFTTEYDPETVESLPMHDMTWILFVLAIILVIVGLVYTNMENWGLG